MGIYRLIVESFLGPLAATADIQRFSRWKADIENALEELESKKGELSKEVYSKKKLELEKKLKRAEELLKKSRERMERFTHKEIRIE